MFIVIDDNIRGSVVINVNNIEVCEWDEGVEEYLIRTVSGREYEGIMVHCCPEMIEYVKTAEKYEKRDNHRNEKRDELTEKLYFKIEVLEAKLAKSTTK
jgi:phosphoenolpyruvate synthase/pyruvate phosphate dikinase